jgi:hypothetical protein
MQGTQLRRATLVVIEYGGNWPRWLSPDRGDMAVVAQHYEGSPGSLVNQVASRLTRLEAVGWRFDEIVLVTNGRTTADASAARCVLARGLVAHMATRHSGNFVLSVNEYAERRAVHELFALAGALDESAHPGIELCVRIGADAPLRPGVHVQERLRRAS